MERDFSEWMRQLTIDSDKISALWSSSFVRKLETGTKHVTGAGYHPLNAREETQVDRKTIIKSRLAKLESELAELERFPEDAFEDGTVIAFERKLKQYGEYKVYKYAAIKVGGWYITGGGTAQNVAWEKLTEWLSDSLDSSVWVMRRDYRIVGEDAPDPAPVEAGDTEVGA